MKTLFEISIELSQYIAKHEMSLEKKIDCLVYYKEKETLSEEDVKYRNLWQELVEEEKKEIKKAKDAYKALTGRKI